MSQTKQPLVSVIILSYNNYGYFYEALDSLLRQDYPNIELLVSNDGSKDFMTDEVHQYLSKMAKKNLRQFTIINNQHNLGTVKSLNNAIKKASGEYVLFFAADDAFHDNKVLSNFMNAFRSLPEDQYIVTAQLGMYDIQLQKLIKPFVDKSTIKFLRKASTLEVFDKMSTRCLVAAASTCYKKALFEKYGYFDERYRLVEDWSSALRFSRLGIKFNYFDFIAFKHRDGGISHGNVNGEVKLNKVYDEDILNIMKYEVKPYLHQLSAKQKTKFMCLYKEHKWRFEYNYKFKLSSSKYEKRLFFVQHWRRIFNSSWLDLRSYFIQQLEGKKFKLFLVSILLLALPFVAMWLKYIAIGTLSVVLGLTIYQLHRIFTPRLVELLRLVI